MELPSLTSTFSASLSPSAPQLPRLGCKCSTKPKARGSTNKAGYWRVAAMAERSSKGLEGEGRAGFSGAGPAVEITTTTTTFRRDFGEAEFPLWEKLGAVVRLSYGIGMIG